MALKDHPLYSCYWDMRQRCGNPKHHSYHNYGGRGITVCDEWKDNFWMFVYHMGPKPSPDLSLDRVDNDYIYSPENCRWATRAQQQSNKRRSVSKKTKGFSKTPTGRYKVQLCIQGQTIYLGVCDTPEEASTVYQQALEQRNLL